MPGRDSQVENVAWNRANPAGCHAPALVVMDPLAPASDGASRVSAITASAVGLAPNRASPSNAGVPVTCSGARSYSASSTIQAKITVARGYARLEWAALDWNEPALNFYEKIGGLRLDDWVLHRLDGARLARVAGKSGPADL